VKEEKIPLNRELRFNLRKWRAFSGLRKNKKNVGGCGLGRIRLQAVSQQKSAWELSIIAFKILVFEFYGVSGVTEKERRQKEVSFLKSRNFKRKVKGPKQ